MFVEYGLSVAPWTPAAAPAEADGEGNWSWTAPELSPSGTWEFRARVVDEWGNSSPYTGKFKLVINPYPMKEDFQSSPEFDFITNKTENFAHGLGITALEQPEYKVRIYYYTGFPISLLVTSRSAVRVNFNNASKIRITYGALTNYSGVKAEVFDINSKRLDVLYFEEVHHPEQKSVHYASPDNIKIDHVIINGVYENSDDLGMLIYKIEWGG